MVSDACRWDKTIILRISCRLRLWGVGLSSGGWERSCYSPVCLFSVYFRALSGVLRVFAKRQGAIDQRFASVPVAALQELVRPPAPYQ